RPALGRFFRPDEVVGPGREPVLVVSHDFWQVRLGGAADIVGQTVRVNDQRLTVVGVAPERFQGTGIGLAFARCVPATLALALLREMGVRLALGARRSRIVGLLLTENVMLALGGAVLGAALAVWASDALRAVPFITSVPVKFQTRIDLGALAFAMLLGALCGV